MSFVFPAFAAERHLAEHLGLEWPMVASIIHVFGIVHTDACLDAARGKGAFGFRCSCDFVERIGSKVFAIVFDLETPVALCEATEGALLTRIGLDRHDTRFLAWAFELRHARPCRDANGGFPFICRCDFFTRLQAAALALAFTPDDELPWQARGGP